LIDSRLNGVQKSWLETADKSYKVMDVKSDRHSPTVGLNSVVFGYDYEKVGYTDSAGRDVSFATGFTADLTLGY